MNRIRRTLAALVTATGALLAFTATAPAAFAVRLPPPGGPFGHPVKHAPVAPAHIHTVVIVGMPGWQISLIAAGAALATAAVAVLLDRARTARKVHTPPPHDRRLYSQAVKPRQAVNAISTRRIGRRALDTNNDA